MDKLFLTIFLLGVLVFSISVSANSNESFGDNNKSEYSANNIEYLSAQQQSQTEVSEPTASNAIQEAIQSQPLSSPLRVIPILFVIFAVIALFIIKRKRKNFLYQTKP